MTILQHPQTQAVTVFLEDTDAPQEDTIIALATRQGWTGPVVVATRDGRVLFALLPVPTRRRR